MRSPEVLDARRFCSLAFDIRPDNSLEKAAEAFCDIGKRDEHPEIADSCSVKYPGVGATAAGMGITFRIRCRWLGTRAFVITLKICGIGSKGMKNVWPSEAISNNSGFTLVPTSMTTLVMDGASRRRRRIRDPLLPSTNGPNGKFVPFSSWMRRVKESMRRGPDSSFGDGLLVTLSSIPFAPAATFIALIEIFVESTSVCELEGSNDGTTKGIEGLSSLGLRNTSIPITFVRPRIHHATFVIRNY
jgi:hypothetical protein